MTDTEGNVAAAHDKDMASRFLAGLDPNATKFTFQFFADSGDSGPRVFHATLDEVWPKVLMLNTPQRGAGAYVTIGETDFMGRKAENIVRPRALFADADSKEQAERCVSMLTACGVCPSMAVNSGRGHHFYFCADIPRDQFSVLQRQLIAKLGTDPAVKDLSRVMRLPGTLHLKDPANPRLVKLLNASGGRWQLPDLVSKLGLSSSTAPNSNVVDSKLPEWVLNSRPAAEFAHLSPLDESLTQGLDTNIDEIRSAVMAIPSHVMAVEAQWMRLARGLAFEARVYKKEKEMWEILDTASRRAGNYDEEDNRRRFQRYMSEATNREEPITIYTVFRMAAEHGWRGWSPPLAPAAPVPIVWSAADLQISFSNIPHRHWLYGTYLIRGEITVLAAPGGAGKTALATGIAVEIATGVELLGDKIWGGQDLKVLSINAEDSGTEIQRRISAFCLAHANKIAGQSLDRLYVAGATDPRVQRLSFLRITEKNLSVLDRSGFEALEAALESLRPDLLILDPLVAFCGGGNMNDNAVMSLVIQELKRLAAKFDCAVLIVHHTRKGGDVGNAESISGAAATVNLARRAIMPVPMAEDEAKRFGVLPSERFRYFKVVDAKSNLAPRSADSPWYRLHSVELPNPEPPLYPFGDNVQAVTREYLPLQNNAPAADDDLKVKRALLALIARGKMIDGQSYPYSPSLAGAQNARELLDDAMAVVAKATASRELGPADLEAVTKRAIETMKNDGWLIEGDMTDLSSKPGRFRRGRGLTVDKAHAPQADIANQGAAPLSDQATPHGYRGRTKKVLDRPK
jgi:hypothetical protein